MNKNIITNLIAAVITVCGLVWQQDVVFSIGLFALSGAMTNWLAIHMLFEKVPFLYGSGIITIKFESFKASIRELILSEFFSKEKLEKFLSNEHPKFDLTPIANKVDLNPAFDRLLNVIEASQFGAMLQMFGGTEAVQPLREPFIEKMRVAIIELGEQPEFDAAVSEALSAGLMGDDIHKTIETAVDERLNELTPKMVKEIIQNMIKTHLGWLVVWGGVFGGSFGLLTALV
ncbi:MULTISPECIES: DUF445 domain-containing protein [unclassified Pseudoalteromonas]|uniref:DUF445 domain-containing protein n=1 Tax=unclassified Pseudoalteromonas TaxID=194690 RepID=UPI000F64C6E6|nr:MULTISPECIES: DUF445 domain-containing protein [unclassified Pseudoalteromonas]RRS08283.1 DUF445 domain-containing protein [Pseudoalteromonas sp. J010]RXF02294.1 DUF445 domain-containing protein [Pseudoalteromonas sp. PS5]